MCYNVVGGNVGQFRDCLLPRRSKLGLRSAFLWYNRISTAVIIPLTPYDLGAILGVGIITATPSNTGGLLC